MKEKKLQQKVPGRLKNYGNFIQGFFPEKTVKVNKIFVEFFLYKKINNPIVSISIRKIFLG